MKFLHLGDLHLGKSLLNTDLIDDQHYILEEIEQIARDNQVDAVVIAGDVYDRSVPSEAAVELFDAFIRRLVSDHMAVFVISGNHDSDERLNFGSSLFEMSGVYIASKFDGSLYHRTLEDAYGTVNFWLLPFVKASQVRHFYPDADIDTYEDAVRTVIENASINPEERNVIVAHQFVTGSGGEKPENAGSEGLAVANVGTVEEIGYHCFDAFDYAALGHIHSPQQVGRREVRYAGSPLKYSLKESASDKSVPLVTLGNKGDVDIELTPLKPKRDLRHLTGRMDQLLEPDNITDTDDYIYATLTDEDPVDDAMGIFQKYYPRTLRIDYRNSHTREIEQTDLTIGTENRSFGDLAEDFYHQMYGCDMDDDERTMLRQAAEEVGVIHEAD